MDVDVDGKGCGKNTYATADAVAHVFVAFWSAYPRKKDKKRAEPVFRSALKTTTADDIMAGLVRWQRNWDRNGTHKECMPYPAKWLRNRQWEDEV